MSELKDSGKRQDFESGCVRDTVEDKSRPDLISPYFNMRVGDHLDKGARKYAERNWEKGMPISRCIASLERHLNQYKMGLTDEDHLAAIGCNIMFIIHYEEMVKRGLMPAKLSDMPFYELEPDDENENARGAVAVGLKSPDYSRAGRPWSAHEDDNLRAGVKFASSATVLAARHRRTTTAMESRMEKLGLKLEKQNEKDGQPKAPAGCNAAYWADVMPSILCKCETCVGIRRVETERGVQKAGKSADKQTGNSQA